MRVLITGAAGFVGSHLTEALLAAGERVLALVRPTASASDNTKRRTKQFEALGARYPGNLELVRAEIGPGVHDVIKKIAPDVCIHLAGRSWVRESIGWPEQYVEANLNRTTILLEALRVAGCKRVVFASSSMIYGADAPLPYMEEETGTFPASPYGATKLGCEMQMNAFAVLHGMQTVNLRLFSVYGPDIRQDCVPFLIAQAAMKGKPFNVFGDGTSLRDYIEVGDVVTAIIAAARGKMSLPALNIGSGFGTSLNELIQMIESGLGKKIELVHKPPVAGELTVAVPDITLAIDKLGWEPKCTIEDGIGDFCRWVKENPAALNGR